AVELDQVALRGALRGPVDLLEVGEVDRLARGADGGRPVILRSLSDEGSAFCLVKSSAFASLRMTFDHLADAVAGRLVGAKASERRMAQEAVRRPLAKAHLD